MKFFAIFFSYSLKTLWQGYCYWVKICTIFWSPESHILGNFDKTVQNYFINRVTALGQKWSRNRFLYESFTYNSWQKNFTFNVSSIFGHNHLMWETTISLYVNFLPKNVNILPTNHFFLINKETTNTWYRIFAHFCSFNHFIKEILLTTTTY